MKPSSVDLAPGCGRSFLPVSRAASSPQVAREDLPAQAPRTLEPPEQKRFLRAVERYYIGAIARLRCCCSTRVCASVNVRRSP